MYYTSRPMTPHITLIQSPSGENLYLVAGEIRAILIDAGLGVGQLRAFAEGLTQKPLTVLLSHGHIDHAPGSAEFEDVYLNSADRPLYRSQCGIPGRMDYLRGNLGDRFEALTTGGLLEADPGKVFSELWDGMVFDLGGVCLRTVSFPGHTPGSTAFLVEEDRVLITGDACNSFTFLFLPEAAPVEAYRASVQRVRDALAGRYDRIFVSHYEPEMPADLLDQMLELCDQVLAGQTDGIPFSFKGYEAAIAKQMDKNFRRPDGKAANLVYNPAKIRSV